MTIGGSFGVCSDNSLVGRRREPFSSMGGRSIWGRLMSWPLFASEDYSPPKGLQVEGA
jgi:hypothetical protein